MKKVPIFLIIVIQFLSCKSYEKRAFSLDDNGRKYDIVHVVNINDISLVLANNEAQKYNSIDFLLDDLTSQNREVLMITNGGMYTPEREPAGLYIENGEIVKSINLNSGYGNFHLKPNGVLVIGNRKADIVVSEDFDSITYDVVYATQSGPMLVIDGNFHPAFNQGSENVNIRSGVGINSDGELFFAISKNKVNFYNFASLFRDELNCNNALYLDGAISRMYVPELERYEIGGNFGVMIVVEK